MQIFKAFRIFSEDLQNIFLKNDIGYVRGLNFQIEVLQGYKQCQNLRTPGQTLGEAGWNDPTVAL